MEFAFRMLFRHFYDFFIFSPCETKNTKNTALAGGGVLILEAFLSQSPKLPYTLKSIIPPFFHHTQHHNFSVSKLRISRLDIVSDTKYHKDIIVILSIERSNMTFGLSL